jgi:hypothetical protein
VVSVRVAKHEDMGGEVAAKGAVVVEARGDGGECFGGVEREAGLGEEVAQLGDLFGITGGEFFELQWL